MKILAVLLIMPSLVFAQMSPQERSRAEAAAKRVTIITDNWGIPHIYGKSDADAVFGLMYIQCQQNFQRVERNYLEVMGRLAEIDGEDQLHSDLQMQLIYDTSAAKADYARSPQWLKKLLIAFADGVNYYLVKNPERPASVLKRFEPWFPLLYTDGSISATQMGGLTLKDTRALYPREASTSFVDPPVDFTNLKLSGSNGFALGPSRTASGSSILYINPHVTFYFRTEVHMVSEEGLNVYGAATWGNFFIYQGFNAHCGWMHTSSYADVADLYKEEISGEVNSYVYRYEGSSRPVKTRNLNLYYKKNGQLQKWNVTGYFTHHGPVVGSRDGQWLSLRERNRSLEALEQSWLRTKANSFAEFKKVMDLRSNNSNNTVYADDQKHIAYWHGNFVPRRDTQYNWALPVDGTIAATEWKGVHSVEETVHLYDPSSGWIQNCNSTPYTSSGTSSPNRSKYPEYMAPDGQNPRAMNAARLLANANSSTIDDIISIGYDRHLTAFDILLPSVITAFDSLEEGTMKQHLIDAVTYLRNWDHNTASSSIATTVAIEWATRLSSRAPAPRTDREATNSAGTLNWLAANLSGKDKLAFLDQTITDLEKLYGTWKMAWGDINRYQRNDQSTNRDFDDSRPSLPVGLASASWGCLPSFNSVRSRNMVKRYGYSGNSFVAAVEFGKRIKAKTIMTGGESFDPSSPHFTDQAEGYIEGKFKEIYFYKEDVLKHAVRTVHPGE